MVASRIVEYDETPLDRPVVRLEGASWADYQRLLELRGESAVPRIAFCEGVLTLVSPSLNHEFLKSVIGCLVEVYCLEAGIEFSTYGSWTLESKEKQRGAEPDECYVFGNVPKPVTPDLAIEVIWTSGGIDKRKIYQGLGVRELWFWRRNRIHVFVLHDDGYREAERSQHLPGLDLELLASFLDRPTTSEAIRAYRDALTAAGA